MEHPVHADQHLAELVALVPRALGQVVAYGQVEIGGRIVKEVAPDGGYDDKAAFDESLTVMLYVIDRMASRLLDPARRAQFFGAVLASVVQDGSGDQNDAVSHALNERYSERVARRTPAWQPTARRPAATPAAA